MGNLQNVASGGGRGSFRFPKNIAVYALALVLINTGTGDLQAWSGTDRVQLKVNTRAVWDVTIADLAAVQDQREAAARKTTVKLTAETLTLSESISFPLAPRVQSSLTGSILAQTPAGAFFCNFGQDLTSPLPVRKAYSLNTGGKGINTVDLEILMGAYTSPRVEVYGLIDPDPVQSDETEIVTMVQTTSVACQASGLNKFSDIIPAKVFRSISFGNLTGGTEGLKLLVNRLEIFNSVDTSATNARKDLGNAFGLFLGQQGAALSTQGTSAAALQPLPVSELQTICFDAGGNVDNLFNASGLTTELSIQTASSKSVTMIVEYIGNPLVD